MKLEDLQKEQFDNGSYADINDEIEHLMLQLKALGKEETDYTNRLVAYTTDQYDKWKSKPGNENLPSSEWPKSLEYLEVENSKLNKRSVHIYNQRQAIKKQLDGLINFKKDPVYTLKYPNTKLGKYPRVV